MHHHVVGRHRHRRAGVVHQRVFGVGEQVNGVGVVRVEAEPDGEHPVQLVGVDRHVLAHDVDVGLEHCDGSRPREPDQRVDVGHGVERDLVKKHLLNEREQSRRELVHHLVTPHAAVQQALCGLPRLPRLTVEDLVRDHDPQ